jgi:recombination endonuclease VII
LKIFDKICTKERTEEPNMPTREHLRPNNRIDWTLMTADEKRAYQAQAQRDHRAKKDRGLTPQTKPEKYPCRSCGIEKPFTKDNFAENKGSFWGLSKVCRPCALRRQKSSVVKKQYGISLETYEAMIATGCAICGTHTGVVMDHCHQTGNLREPLCNGCNTGLGSFQDDPARLRKAAAYVEKHVLFG